MQTENNGRRERMIGLTSEEAERLLKANGGNRLASARKINPVKIFAGQFHDVMVAILLVAAVISVFAGGLSDAVPIMIIVLLNSALGFFQEYRCEKTLEQMERLTAPTARVYRDGRLCVIPAGEVVTGDVFEIEAGDRFPCDCVILSESALACDESALTGETTLCEKTSYRMELASGKPDALNLPYIGYMGTVAVRGKAQCEAIATGTDAQMGKISKMLAEIDDSQTPLQKKLGELGKVLALICLAVCIVVFAAGVIRGEDTLNMFFTAVTIAIAAIPEGLPAAVTIALALAVRRILKQNALVHRLHSVETLGCAEIIFTDKTGTLTKNEMTVRNLSVLSDRLRRYEYPDDGEKGLIGKFHDESHDRYMAWDNTALSETLLCAALCNNASKNRRERRTAGTESGRRRERKGGSDKRYSGDPTEAALLQLCEDCGIDTEHLLLKRIDEKPFDSAVKYMSVICRDREGRKLVFTKGAPEIIVSMCTHRYEGAKAEKLSERDRAAVLSENESLASQGLRVIAFCESAGEYVIFLGLAAMSDPLRPQAAEAVRECRRAGISTVMITGDHKLTACAAAREAGILTASKRVVTGEELDAMSDEELSEKLSDIAVFARVTPEHKLKIVRAAKNNGLVCAMTGDGVNDAPAVKEASIGVSMGISGTDVTKQAADMILLDDNFATLVTAVREGRTIYANIRKFVRYLIACNIGEVLTMFGAIIMGMPLVLVPAQLLLVNLVTDGLPAAALSVEPPEEGIMSRPPRSESDSFFSDGLIFRIVSRGILIAIASLFCFSFMLSHGSGIAAARTSAMLTLVFSQLIHVFECRSEQKSLFETGFRGAGYAAAAAFSSAVCVAVCMAVPSLAEIFSLVNPGISGIIVSAVTSAAVPLICGISGKLRSVHNFRYERKLRKDIADT